VSPSTLDHFPDPADLDRSLRELRRTLRPGGRLILTLRLPNGNALNGFSHGYKRHGTTTLFAAFDIATGQVLAGHYNRRRRREFLDFMHQIVVAYPDRDIHVVLDNLNTHKPKEDRWLKRHPRVHPHFIPTYSSWLNQVECWFSILGQQALQGVSFTSPEQLREAIDRFVNGPKLWSTDGP
jgi:transposase